MYCYGHFYQMRIAGDHPLRCRSVLEITVCRYRMPNVLLNEEPDAVVVMMNPGSSEPEQAMEEQMLNFLDPRDIRARCRLVPTRPDNTQTQIMKIIRRTGYNHIRVINLSDICEPDSSRFFRIVSQEGAMQNNHIQASHSIFSQYRSRELRCRMNPRSGIVIAGWGNSWKTPRWRCSFAERCYDMIRAFGFHIIGYQDDDDRDHIFVHPFYKSIMKNWPDCIVSQVRENLRNRQRR